LALGLLLRGTDQPAALLGTPKPLRALWPRTQKTPMLLTSHFFDQARTRVFSALVLIALCALAPLTLSAQAEPEEEEEDFGPVYVRRFSAGARLRYLPLETIDSGTLNRAVTDPVLFRAVNDPQSAHFSYGMTTQVAVTNKWAVAVEALTHRIKYQEMRDVTTFFIDPFDNILLETQLETEDENTVARIWDIPILLRYYNKSRYTRGARVFFEGGLTVRRLTNIKTAIETTFSTTDFETPDSTDCCDRTPIEPANPSSLGGTVGIGVQVIDDIGVRVVPGFRYTRWFSNALDNPPTRTIKNQIEASLSFTF